MLLRNLSILGLLFFALFFFNACSNPPQNPAAFYHWKATLDIGELEQKYLDSLESKKLYVRFFDVHWDAKRKTTYPLAQLEWNDFDIGRSLEIIPVIYITNISLKKTENNKDLDSLAKNIAEKLDLMLSKLDTEKFVLRELQLDCDWSETTQRKYFKLIDKIRDYLPQIETLSATIRLHQVKYFNKTGVPPVDKGMLMFYNMGEVILKKKIQF